MANIHYDSNTLTGRVGQNANSAHPRGWMFGDNFGKWVAFVGTYCTTSAVLVAHIPIKFEGGELSAYESHGWFLITSVVSLAVTIFTSWIIFYTNNDLENAMKEHFSDVYNMILNSVFWSSSIISHVSLVLVVFIPHKIIWAGYVIQFVVFVVILALNLKDPIKRICGRVHG